jgi:hypothetical protein
MSGELPLLDILLPIDLATRKPDLAASIACDEAKRGYGDRTMRAPKQADYIAVRDRRMGLSSEVIMKACWEAMVTGQSTQADKLALKGNESLTLLAIVEANKSAEKAGQPRPDATSTMRRCWRAMIGVKLQVAKRYASEGNKAFTLFMIREVARAAAKVGHAGATLGFAVSALLEGDDRGKYGGCREVCTGGLSASSSESDR